MVTVVAVTPGALAPLPPPPLLLHALTVRARTAVTAVAAVTRMRVDPDIPSPPTRTGFGLDELSEPLSFPAIPAKKSWANRDPQSCAHPPHETLQPGREE